MIRILLVCVGCMLVVGCGGSGPATAPVSGTVTMDGSPVANASVTFVPDGGGATATGQTDSSGKYSLSVLDKKGAILGKYTVKVTSMQAAAGGGADVGSDSAAYEQMSGGDYAAGSKSVEEKIPAKYNAKSELKYEVVAGDNTYDIPMTSK